MATGEARGADAASRQWGRAATSAASPRAGMGGAARQVRLNSRGRPRPIRALPACVLFPFQTRPASGPRARPRPAAGRRHVVANPHRKQLHDIFHWGGGGAGGFGWRPGPLPPEPVRPAGLPPRRRPPPRPTSGPRAEPTRLQIAYRAKESPHWNALWRLPDKRGTSSLCLLAVAAHARARGRKRSTPRPAHPARPVFAVFLRRLHTSHHHIRQRRGGAATSSASRPLPRPSSHHPSPVHRSPSLISRGSPLPRRRRTSPGAAKTGEPPACPPRQTVSGRAGHAGGGVGAPPATRASPARPTRAAAAGGRPRRRRRCAGRCRRAVS